MGCHLRAAGHKGLTCVFLIPYMIQAQLALEAGHALRCNLEVVLTTIVVTRRSCNEDPASACVLGLASMSADINQNFSLINDQ
jgi:hypothetical protein